MEGLKQFIVSIVEQTIQSLHDRGLAARKRRRQRKSRRMFNGKLELSINDLAQHPACGWSRKKTIKLLRDKHIEDLGTSARDYRISAVSVYRFLTKEKISQTGVDMNRPPAKRKRKPLKYHFQLT